MLNFRKIERERKMAKKVKNMLKNNVVLCVLVLAAIGLISTVFAADVKVKSGTAQIANNTYLKATNNAGTGTVDLIKANTSDVAVLPDGSELATSAAPTADADIANKKYVDDQIGAVDSLFGSWTSTDSESNAFAQNNVYKAESDGFVCMRSAAYDSSGGHIRGYTDSS